MTDVTYWFFFRSDAAVLTASLYFESVSLPLLACKMIGLVPLACAGKGFCKRLVAWSLPVPGRDKLSLRLSPIRWEIATVAIATTSQKPSTHQRWRVEKRPSLYRYGVTARARPS